MSDLVVCDSGPLIALGGLGLLKLLPQLSTRAVAPQSVVAEVTTDAARPGAVQVLAALQQGWLVAHADPAVICAEASCLDHGEAAAITLAWEWKAALLIDEARGRAVAQRLGLLHTGTVGLLAQARQRGLTPPLAPLLAQLQSSGYYLSPQLVQLILARVDE